MKCDLAGSELEMKCDLVGSLLEIEFVYDLVGSEIVYDYVVWSYCFWMHILHLCCGKCLNRGCAGDLLPDMLQPAFPAKSDLPPTVFFVAKNKDRLPKVTSLFFHLLPKAWFAAKSLVCCRFLHIWRQITDTPSVLKWNGFTVSHRFTARVGTWIFVDGIYGLRVLRYIEHFPLIFGEIIHSCILPTFGPSTGYTPTKHTIPMGYCKVQGMLYRKASDCLKRRV